MVFIIFHGNFFQFGSGGLRGLQNIYRKIFGWDVRKYSLCNRVANNWNCLSAPCVNSGTINTFTKHVSIELEPETVVLLFLSR